MTATLAPAEFAAAVEELTGHAPDAVWSRFGFQVMDMMQSGGGQVRVPWVPLAVRGRRYRGVHRYNRFRRRGLTVADVQASL